MANALMDTEVGETLRVGDVVDAGPEDYRLAFLPLREPDWNGGIRVLHAWSCPSCNRENWAMLTFRASRLESISPVYLTRTALDDAHFLSEDADQLFFDLTGETLYVEGGPRPGFAAILRAHLPADATPGRDLP
jgi:hypothetical protein